VKLLHSSRPERRFVVVAGALVAVWTACVLAIGPWLIRSAYAEESLSFLNNLFGGRSIHPVQRYLDAWWAAVPKATIALLAMLAVGYLCVRGRARIRAAFRDDSWSPVTTASALLVAVWLGWWMGLIDISYRLLDVALVQRTKGAGLEDLWLAPILGAVVVGAVGLAVWKVAARVRGASTLQPVAAVGVGFFFYSWLRLFGLGIHPLAAVVLALGLASQLSRPLVTWGDGFVRLVRRTLPWMTAATIVTAVSMGASESLAERRAMAGLGPARDGATNVLLLILDTARAKSMSLYGAERLTTPNIDRLAQEGVVFDWAIAPTPWTLPSHATYFTGLWPHEHGADMATRLGDDFDTLAEVLSEQGYATGGFAANMEFTLRTTGLDQGFHRYRDDSISLGRFVGSLNFVRAPLIRARQLVGIRKGMVRKHAVDVNREFLDWLDGPADSNRPFFAFLNYFDVHAGYEPQAPFDTLFSPAGDRYWIGDEWRVTESFGPTDLEELETSYDEAMAYLDHHIGLLFEELVRRGRLDNTLVVITSDHGEHFGEHGLLSHQNSLYMPVMRVPMVVIDRQGRVPVGARIETPVALRDIAATILDLAELPTRLPGESLARYWREDPPGEPILTQVDNGFGRWSMRGVLYGGWNYVRNYGGDVPEELYGLGDDPDELLNRATDLSVEGLSDRLDRMRVLADSLDTGPEPQPAGPSGGS